MKRLKLINLALKHRDGIMVLFYLVYAVILDYALMVVASAFYYEGFFYISNPDRTLLSYGLVIFLAYATGKFIVDKISSLFYVGFFCMFIVPGIVYFMRTDTEYWQVLLLSGGYVWLLIVSNIINRIPFKINNGHNQTISYSILFSITILTYGLAIYYLGFKFNLDLYKVYDIRSHFLERIHFPLGYFVIWQGNIINPLLFYWTVQKNRYLFTGVIIVSQIYLFSVTGFKIFLFSLVFSYLFARYSKPLKLLMPILLSIIVALSCGIYLYIGNVWCLSLIARRTLFTPAQITYYYFDFFHDNPLVYLSDSALKYLFTYPYMLPSPLIIGIRYFDSQSANTGIFGNAYMNFGIPGVFLFVSVLPFILSIFDRIAASKEDIASLIMASVAMTLVSIINSGLLTVLLTHGMLLALLLAFFI
jgi:hypothetical protein